MDEDYFEPDCLKTVSVEHPVMADSIFLVARELPSDVRDFVRGIFFISPPIGFRGIADYWEFFPDRHHFEVDKDGQARFGFIVLNGELADGPEDLRHFVIAHEIAHLWSGDSTLKNEGTMEEREQNADDLAAEWGFPRPADS